MSDSSDDDQDTRKIKKTVDFQRIQLEKLMKNPVRINRLASNLVLFSNV